MFFQVSEEDIEEMFNFADQDKDGKISYTEFQTMINPPEPPPEHETSQLKVLTKKKVTIKASKQKILSDTGPVLTTEDGLEVTKTNQTCENITKTGKTGEEITETNEEETQPKTKVPQSDIVKVTSENSYTCEEKDPPANTMNGTNYKSKPTE